MATGASVFPPRLAWVQDVVSGSIPSGLKVTSKAIMAISKGALLTESNLLGHKWFGISSHDGDKRGRRRLVWRSDLAAQSTPTSAGLSSTPAGCDGGLTLDRILKIRRNEAAFSVDFICPPNFALARQSVAGFFFATLQFESLSPAAARYFTIGLAQHVAESQKTQQELCSATPDRSQARSRLFHCELDEVGWDDEHYSSYDKWRAAPYSMSESDAVAAVLLGGITPYLDSHSIDDSSSESADELDSKLSSHHGSPMTHTTGFSGDVPSHFSPRIHKRLQSEDEVTIRNVLSKFRQHPIPETHVDTPEPRSPPTRSRQQQRSPWGGAKVTRSSPRKSPTTEATTLASSEATLEKPNDPVLPSSLEAALVQVQAELRQSRGEHASISAHLHTLDISLEGARAQLQRVEDRLQWVQVGFAIAASLGVFYVVAKSMSPEKRERIKSLLGELF